MDVPASRQHNGETSATIERFMLHFATSAKVCWRTRPVRRVALAALLLLLTAAAGCTARADGAGKLDLVWGRRGISDGRFQKPRAIAIDGKDQLYIVDMTARIQVFD